MTIGQKIKQLRKEQGLSQLDLALKINRYSCQSIHFVETGKEDIRFSKLVDISKALGVKVGSLIE